jgi:prophage regulatory protein
MDDWSERRQQLEKQLPRDRRTQASPTPAVSPHRHQDRGSPDDDPSAESSPTLIDFKQLKAKGVPYGKSRLWQLEQEHKFPQRVRLSAVRVCWIAHEVDAWVAERIATRAPKSAA